MTTMYPVNPSLNYQHLKPIKKVLKQFCLSFYPHPLHLQLFLFVFYKCITITHVPLFLIILSF